MQHFPIIFTTNDENCMPIQPPVFEQAIETYGTTLVCFD